MLLHRPILRWTLERGVPYFAQKAGYTVKWDIAGSITTSLAINKLSVTGPDGGPIIKAEWASAEAQYQILKLARGNLGEGLDSLALSDVQIEADLRRRPNAPPKVKKPRKPGPPPDVWVKRVDLRSLNARLITEKGDIVLKGLTLVLDPSQSGELRIDELIVPSAKLHLTGVQGKTEVTGRTITFTDLRVSDGTRIPRLAVDLGALKDGSVAVDLAANLADAAIALKGNVSGIGTLILVDAEASIQNLTPSALQEWVKLPPQVSWKVDTLELAAKGDPKSPQLLNARVEGTASQIKLKDVPELSLQLQAALADGELKITSLNAGTATNTVKVATTAQMPGTWKESGKLSAEVAWSLHAADLSEFSRPNLALAGQLDAAGKLSLQNGAPVSVQANIDGKAITAGKTRIESVKGEISSDATSASIKTLTLRLDEKNAVSLQGRVGLRDRRTTAVEWNADVPDLALLTETLGLPPERQVKAGVLTSTGKAQFDINDLIEKNFSRAEASANINLTGLDWQGKRLREANVTAALNSGIVTLQTLDIALDDANHLSAKATMALAGRRPVEASWNADLMDLASVGAWAGLKNLPPPESGTAKVSGEAKFDLADLQEKNYAPATATISAAVKDVIWQGERLDRLSVEAAVTGGVATLQKLDFYLNERNYLTAKGAADLQARTFQADVSGNLSRLTDLNPWLVAANRLKKPTTPATTTTDPAPTLVPLPTDPPGGTPVTTGRTPVTPQKSPVPAEDADPKIRKVEKRPGQPLQFTSGSAKLDWHGGGGFDVSSIHGAASLDVANVKLEGRPQTFALRLDSKHEGKRAEITKFLASADQLKAELSGSVNDTELRIPKLSLAMGSRKLIDGSILLPLAVARTTGPGTEQRADVHLRMDDLNFNELFGYLSMKPPVKGTARMTLDIAGNLDNIEGQLALTLRNVEANALAGKLAPASADVNATLKGNQFQLKAEVREPGLQPLTVQADAPLVFRKLLSEPKSLLNAPITASVKMAPSDLSIVRKFSPAITSIQGTAGVDVEINGTPLEPHWKGQIVAQVPSAELKASSMSIRDAAVRIAFLDRRINIEQFYAQVAGGEVRVTGGADFADVKNPAFDVRLSAKEALITRSDTLSQRADADITVKGTLAAAHVSGGVQLVRGRVFKEIEFLPLSLPNQLPPPPPAVRATSKVKPSAPPPFDKWTIDVSVTHRDPIRLLGNVLNGGVMVNLTARGTGAAPDIEGKVTLDGARLQLPFSRVKITKGDIIFTKDKPLDPQLDLVGESLVNGYQITLYAYGSAFAPKTRFTSSPPLTEGEIATLVTTGTTPDDLASSEGVAANRAAYLAFSQAYRKLFRKGTKRRYDEEPPKLTFGVNPVASSSGSGSSQSGVTATYELSPNTQISAEAGDRGFRGLFYYLVRFR